MDDAKGGISPGFHVQYLPMMVCAACKGDGVGDRGSIVHINRGDQPHEWREVCSKCHGRKEIAPSDHKAAGLAKRHARLVCQVSLREEARRLGITAAELSAIECGRAILLRESGNG